MTRLELLAPARNLQIGIAAIDCGADAVYIAGPRFGARHAAGNGIEDIRQLCTYAHKFGARIFVTLNTILYDDELEEAYGLLLDIRDAGADAVIVQDLAFVEMAANGINGRKESLGIPLHASTQCAIRTPEQARFLESLGFSRLILERELSLQEIRQIRQDVSCELEFFVHGALCVCYSGQCYLSEHIAGRSANRGQCIQACRSRYDLVDAAGNTLVRDKALLSLKDFNLKSHLSALAGEGICSFKIEGRLKNASYVKNVVRDYSNALDAIVAADPKRYGRASFGSVRKGFVPDTRKTFNRGYTSLFIEGRKGEWASSEAAKSMGEEIGTVTALNGSRSLITIRPASTGITLNNGDGFSFVAKDGSINGVRGDVCSGNTISCKSTPSLFVGARLYRNMNAAFEKEMERQTCIREIRCRTDLSFSYADGVWKVCATAESEDGRIVSEQFDAGTQRAENQTRMMEMATMQLSKSAGHYLFETGHIEVPEEGLPLMPASGLNAIRRTLAEKLDEMPCRSRNLLHRPAGGKRAELAEDRITYKANVSNRLAGKVYTEAGAKAIEPAYEISHTPEAELMRTRYCIRHELGICPKHHSSKVKGPLFLLNNGQRLELHFDCSRCEMIIRTPPSRR